ncbi:MAG: hypothetical protein NC078_06230 [Ruminococcus sp.]|nr:hypothetical protein [Ruminococcus sp.]
MTTTILLTLLLCVLYFLAILTATLTLPCKGLTNFFPEDVKEAMSPRLDSLPMSGKRIAGIGIIIIIAAAMLGIYIFGGLDGVKNGFGFGQMYLRFFILDMGMKAFDIIGLDWFLLTKTNFFPHFFPETKDCKGRKDFGFNRKEQIKRCIILPLVCAVLAFIFARL